MKANNNTNARITIAAMLATGLLLMMLPVWLMVTLLHGATEGIDWSRQIGLLLAGPAVWILLTAVFAVLASWVLSPGTRPDEVPRPGHEQQRSGDTEPREARVRAGVELYHRPF